MYLCKRADEIGDKEGVFIDINIPSFKQFMELGKMRKKRDVYKDFIKGKA